jgi:hypothetical protein
MGKLSKLASALDMSKKARMERAKEMGFLIIRFTTAPLQSRPQQCLMATCLMSLSFGRERIQQDLLFAVLFQNWGYRLLISLRLRSRLPI